MVWTVLAGLACIHTEFNHLCQLMLRGEHVVSTVYRPTCRSIQVSMEVERGGVDVGRTACLKVACNLWHYSVTFATNDTRSERAYTDHIKSLCV